MFSGSAVTDSLSFSTVNEGSTRTATGAFQVTPPLLDVLTWMELAPPKAGPLALKARLAW